MMDKPDVDELVDRCLDGLANADELTDLKRLLERDPAARGVYVDACAMRQDLGEELAVADGPVSSSVAARRRHWGAWTGAFLALAATLALIFQGLPQQPPPADPMLAEADAAAPIQPEPQEPPLDPQAVGRIVKKINCVWRDESWSLGQTPAVFPGQTIDLERGFMQLSLRNGVTVVLEGPAEFTVVDELHGSLDFGGVGVRVPKGFSGYVVDTPSAKVVDLGTEFSVLVSDSGDTDLRVIDGEVRVQGMGPSRKAKPQTLTKDAVWSSVAEVKRPSGPPKPSDFPTAGLMTDPEFKTTPRLPVTEALRLWLAADTAVKVDSKEGVVVWGDISSPHVDERHSAWQVESRRRPKLVPGDEGGQPWVRFDGRDDCLITEPFATKNAQSIALVGRFNSLRPKSNTIPSLQILNYNGPPQLVIERRSWGKLRGTAFSGLGVAQPYSGRVRVEAPLRPRQMFSLVYVYDHPNNYATIYFNGKQHQVAEAAFPVATARPKVIGMHRRLADAAFNGDLGEMAIYDRRLSEGEIGDVFRYFDSRYGVLVEERD